MLYETIFKNNEFLEIEFAAVVNYFMTLKKIYVDGFLSLGSNNNMNFDVYRLLVNISSKICQHFTLS